MAKEGPAKLIYGYLVQGHKMEMVKARNASGQYHFDSTILRSTILASAFGPRKLRPHQICMGA
jgi:hypothetical protein